MRPSTGAKATGLRAGDIRSVVRSAASTQRRTVGRATCGIARSIRSIARLAASTHNSMAKHTRGIAGGIRTCARSAPSISSSTRSSMRRLARRTHTVARSAASTRSCGTIAKRMPRSAASFRRFVRSAVSTCCPMAPRRTLGIAPNIQIVALSACSTRCATRGRLMHRIAEGPSTSMWKSDRAARSKPAMQMVGAMRSAEAHYTKPAGRTVRAESSVAATRRA
mmetsp:Transcript_116634/g.371007  ORF Transcript_116634/g.371007 Transcript_116634/m.371007 type:complete len:223 (+) Transcript_116634:1499-2167(+)